MIYEKINNDVISYKKKMWKIINNTNEILHLFIM